MSRDLRGATGGAFGLLIVAALLTVLLPSSVQVRRSLVPLTRLREGTHRIASRDFDNEILLESGDEFDDLANSLSSMASRLSRQLGALRAINAIDRAAPSSTGPHHVIDAAFARRRDVLRM